MSITSKLLDNLSFRSFSHPWLLVMVLVLLVNAFSVMLMVSHHQPSTQHQISATMDHVHEHAVHHQSHCSENGQMPCGEKTADIDCSISHCSPVGIIAFAFTTPVDPGSTTYQESSIPYQSLISDSPYIPPISARI